MPWARRDFLKLSGLAALAGTMPAMRGFAQNAPAPDTPADYTIRIGTSLVELGPNQIISTTTYNGQFPGPLLRFTEGQRTTVDIHNDTDTPEQLHWHGRHIPSDVDGASEENSPFIPPHGSRRVSFVPGPAGLRFYHSHQTAGANLNAGLYTGQAGPVYIEPKREPGRYDREVFLVLKEFESALSRGGDMAMDFLNPAAPEAPLKEAGESAMKASLAKGDAAWLRGRLQPILDQRSNARTWRAGAREVGRARAVSCAQCQRHRDTKPGVARPHLYGGGAGRQSGAHARVGSGPLDRHGRACLRDCRDEPSRCVGPGRPVR